VLLTSDIHYTYLTTWYGATAEERTQAWVDAVLYEHSLRPFDLIVIMGDVSLDHWEWNGGGTYLKDGVSTTKTFMENYVSQLPADVPVFVLAGNHEQFGNAKWKELTGNERQGAMVVKDNLFIMLDNYNSKLEPNRTGDPDYTPTDVAFVKSQLEKYPDCKNVWLVAHHFEPKEETQEFKDLVKNEKRIKGLFSGHTHKSEFINLGSEFGNKKLAQTGNYSYSYYAAMNTGTFSDVLNSFWGFRDLVITDEYAMSQYIVADTKGPVVQFDGSKHTIDIKRKTVFSVRFY
jgi:predicted MPP superfamily phosphohydrolase